MDMNNKNGISAIVATVLIILITVAAVTIIWAAIIPMVSDNLEKGKVCLDASSGGVTILNEGYTCRNSTDLNVQIKQGPKDFGLSDVQIIVTGNGNSQTFNVVEDLSYTLLPGPNGQLTYSIPDSYFTAFSLNQIDEVEAAPIVSVGGGTQACDVVSKVEIRPCS
jgi:FlaG/FlaF family flagellin (archaellin)